MDVQAALNDFNVKLNAFFTFIADKLKDFPNLTLGEQIAYCCVGLGLVLIIISIVLFAVM